MTFWILLVVALALTYIMMRWHNVAWALGAVLAWSALFFYNFDNPPTNIIENSLIHQLTIYAVLLMVLGTIVAYIVNGKRGYTGYPKTAKEQAEFDSERQAKPEEKSIMQMSESEYKAHIRKKARGKAR